MKTGGRCSLGKYAEADGGTRNVWCGSKGVLADQARGKVKGHCGGP